MTQGTKLSSRLAALAALLPAPLVAILVAVPLVSVAVLALSPANDAWRHLSQTVLAGYIGNSVMLILIVGLLAGCIGVGSAWLVATCRFPGRGMFSWMLMLPLAAPAYVVAYAYTDLLDVSGPLQTALRSLPGLDSLSFAGVRSLPGAAIMLSLVLYPYVYLLCRSSFAASASSHFDAARVLGKTSTGAFLAVALPAARPAIAGGIALVLMETLAD